MARARTIDTLLTDLDAMKRQIERLQQAGGPPAGAIFSFGGITVPAGYLLCDGRAVSRQTYAILFGAISFVVQGTTAASSNTITGVSAADIAKLSTGMPLSGQNFTGVVTITGIGTSSFTVSANATAAGPVYLSVCPYGAGDGSTTFTLPDFRGRSPLGAGLGTAVGATTHALGTSGGEETHLLTAAESGLRDHGHSASVNLTAGWWQGSTHDHYAAGNLAEAPQWGANTAHLYNQNWGVGVSNNGNWDASNRHNVLHPFQTATIIIKA